MNSKLLKHYRFMDFIFNIRKRCFLLKNNIMSFKKNYYYQLQKIKELIHP